MSSNPAQTAEPPVTPGGSSMRAGHRTNDDATHHTPAPALPPAYAHLAGEPELAAAWNKEHTIRTAQAEQLQLLLDYRNRRLQEEKPSHAFNRQAVIKAIHREAALILGVTEHRVRRMLTVAATAQDWLPATWAQYRTGQLDLDRVEKITDGAADLIETNSGTPTAQRRLTTALDNRFAHTAGSQNPRSLAQQVRDAVAELDTAGHQRRYQTAHSRRYVAITAHSDGMSTLKALLPSIILEPLAQQLHTHAVTAPRTQPHQQPGTQDQDPGTSEATYHNRMADILTTWLTTGSQHATEQRSRPQGSRDQDNRGQAGGASGVPTVGVNITVPLDTLTGTSDAPAVSSDGRYCLPAAEARAIINDPTLTPSFYLTGTTSTTTTGNGARTGTGSTATEAEAGTGAGRDGSRKPVRIVKLDRTTSKNLQNLLTTQNPEQITQFITGQLAGGKNLLEAASTGRFATGTLRTAIQLRDQTCQAYQCTEPAYRTEVDHQTSYETGGPTSAANSQLLCRHHHELKSHRLLPELNTSTDPPPD